MARTGSVLPGTWILLRKVLVIGYRVAVVITIVMQGHTVKLLERISNLTHGGCESRVQRDPFDLSRADVYTLTLLDISEVGCLYAMALVWNDGRFRVAEQRPLSSAEERCSLDVRSASARAESSSLILDE